MAERFQPELVQGLMMKATPGSYALPEWVESMFEGILSEWRRVWWNTHRREDGQDYDDTVAGSLGKVTLRDYCWLDYDDPDPDGIAQLPNFAMEGDDIEIRWYKHPGRSMSVNRPVTTEEWIAWHDRVMNEMKDHDSPAAMGYQRRKRLGLA